MPAYTFESEGKNPTTVNFSKMEVTYQQTTQHIKTLQTLEEIMDLLENIYETTPQLQKVTR